MRETWAQIADLEETKAVMPIRKSVDARVIEPGLQISCFNQELKLWISTIECSVATTEPFNEDPASHISNEH